MICVLEIEYQTIFKSFIFCFVLVSIFYNNRSGFKSRDSKFKVLR